MNPPLPVRCQRWPASALIVLAKAEFFQTGPPVEVGDLVRLNSGGPACLVVDADGDATVTISWRDSGGDVFEWGLPRACVHRIKDCAPFTKLVEN
jgi:uncharacterized protein YodC (DUF2158 family)